MTDFDVWRTILRAMGPPYVASAHQHIDDVEKFFAHPVQPGRRARLLTLAQTLDDAPCR